MGRRIRTGTEDEWREIGRRVKRARAALTGIVAKLFGEIVAVSYADRVLRLIERLTKLASDLEEEMFRRGGPEDTHVFFGPLGGEDEDADDDNG